jgi:alkylhydroperoxidase family enzyme
VGSYLTPPARHRDAVERLRRSVLEGPGRTEADLRQAVAAHAAELWRSGTATTELPAELGSYVEKVALHAYKVTDEDLAALRDAGYDEDEILELTLSCALGCGLSALSVGLAAARAEA